MLTRWSTQLTGVLLSAVNVLTTACKFGCLPADCNSHVVMQKPHALAYPSCRAVASYSCLCDVIASLVELLSLLNVNLQCWALIAHAWC